MKEKGQLNSRFTEIDIEKCIRAHSEYFTLKSDVVSSKPISHKWPSVEMELQAAKHLQERLKIKKEIQFKELYKDFDPPFVPNLTNYLQDGITSVNEKLLHLLMKYYEYFTICDGYLKYDPTVKIKENKSSSSIYRAMSVPNLHTASAGSKIRVTSLENSLGIVYYAEDTYGVIVSEVSGKNEFIYFDLRAVAIIDGRLYRYYPPGTYVTFDAIRGPPDKKYKWRATKVVESEKKSKEKRSLPFNKTKTANKQDKKTDSAVTMNEQVTTELALGSQKDKQVTLMVKVTQENEKVLDFMKRGHENTTNNQEIHEHGRPSGQKKDSKEQITALNKDQETIESQLKEIEDRFRKITEERNSILTEELEKIKLAQNELGIIYNLQREKNNDVDLEVVQVKKRCKDTETMLDKFNEKLDIETVQLKKDLKDMKATFTELRTKLEHSERQQIDLKATVTTLNDKLKKSAKEQSDLEKTVTKFNNKIEKSEKDVNQTKSIRNELKAELNILVQEKNNLKMQIGYQQTALTTYDVNMKESLKIHIEESKKEGEQMKRNQRHLQDSLDNLQEKLQTSELEQTQQREHMKNAQQDLQNTVTELQMKLNKSEKECQQLNKDLNVSLASNKSMQTRIDKIEISLAEVIDRLPPPVCGDLFLGDKSVLDLKRHLEGQDCIISVQNKSVEEYEHKLRKERNNYGHIYIVLQIFSQIDSLRVFLDFAKQKATTGITVASILPRPNVSDHNEKAASLNRQIESICRELRVHFVNNDMNFKNLDGSVKDEYYHDDDVILTDAGIKRLLQNMGFTLSAARATQI